MNSSLRRAARYVLKPNAIILGVATGMFGWSLAETVRTFAEFDFITRPNRMTLCLASALLLAAFCLAAKRALGNLLAAFLSAPLPLLLIFSFFLMPPWAEASFFSVRHVRLWLREWMYAPAGIWLLTGLSFAILCSATAATLRRTPSRT